MCTGSDEICEFSYNAGQKEAVCQDEKTHSSHFWWNGHFGSGSDLFSFFF